jgi:hypothetical protein
MTLRVLMMQTTVKLTAGRAPRELSFKTVFSGTILLFCHNAKVGQSECANTKYKSISLTFSVDYYVVPVHSRNTTPGKAVVTIRISRGLKSRRQTYLAPTAIRLDNISEREDKREGHLKYERRHTKSADISGFWAFLGSQLACLQLCL